MHTRFTRVTTFLSAALALSAAPAIASAQTATWDDLPNGSFVNTPNPYAGHNFYYVNQGNPGAFGSGAALQYSTLNSRCHSGTNCAYNASGTTAVKIESTDATAGNAFSFAAFVSGGYPGNSAAVGLKIQGYVGTSTTALFTDFITLPGDNSWVSYSNSNAVNRIVLTGVDVNGEAHSGYFLLDDVTMTGGSAAVTTPEPTSLALLGTGLVGLVPAIRRRRK